MQKVVQTPIPVTPDPEPTDNAALSTIPSASGGLGALEWKAHSVEPASVDPVEVTTEVCVPPELPDTVTLRYDDGESLAAGVWWRPYDDGLLASPGSFTIGGVIENNLVEAEATVHVVGEERPC